MDSQVRIVHVITGTRVGGSEMMLYKVLSRLDRKRFESIVVTLESPDALSEWIERLGHRIYSLHLRSGRFRVRNIIEEIRRFRPAIVQGWMVHGNIAALFASVLVRRDVPVLWNVRHSLPLPKNLVTATLVRLMAYVSSRPRWILYNSHASALQHEALGYDPRRTVVIPNGFDCSAFRPDAEARAAIRNELGLSDGVPLIGLVARVHPDKDQGNFLRAAELLISQGSQAHFLMVGRGTRACLAAQSPAVALNDRYHALDERRDMAAIMNALDIATCSSQTEAFPNVVGEAMSCGVPAVVTDVGDSARLVGDTGRVVPARNSAALAEAWQELLDLGPAARRELGEASRRRILSEFSLQRIVTCYEQLYWSVARGNSVTSKQRAEFRQPVGLKQ
ncbi:MAG TPA: glycosyltransferase [Bryobacteraceae bacterium]|nr:glycosyltransferase [Bryobacteraceae bacterium]